MSALHASFRRVLEEGNYSKLRRVSCWVRLSFLQLSVQILGKPKLVVVFIFVGAD
jgi:hypothetical protein